MRHKDTISLNPTNPAFRTRYSDELPSRVQKYFNRNEPIYQLMEPVSIHWRHYRFEAYAGLYWDGSSVPWWTRIFGASRHGALWKYYASIPHDCLCWGFCAFPDARGYMHSRKLANELYRAVGLFLCAPPDRRAVRWYYRAVCLGAWPVRKPRLRPELATINLDA